MFSGLLDLFGLASLRRLQAATARADQLKARADDLAERLETARQDTERRKQKNQETETKLATAAKETERWKQKHVGYLAKFSQLKRAERLTKLAREHLLALETKLDVIEGAIAVLDRRTRGPINAPDPTAPEQADTSRE